MPIEQALARTQRATLLALCVLPFLFFWPAALDRHDIAQWTVVIVGAVVVIATAAGRTLARGELSISLSPPGVAAGGFVVAAAVAGVTSGAPVVSLFGAYGRFAGLLLYAAAVTVFFAVLAVFPGRRVRVLAVGLLVGAAGVALYGAGQLAGLDATHRLGPFGDAVYATLSNPNFASGLLGSTLALFAWAFLASVGPKRARWLYLAGGVLAAVVIVATRSEQGLVAGGVAIAFFLFCWVRASAPPWRRWAYICIAAGFFAGGALLVAGLLGMGPLAGLSRQVSFALRQVYWSAAWEMFAVNPVFGVGLDRYVEFFRATRPAAGVELLNMTTTSNAAHNVFLHFLAGGGLILAGAFLAFVGATGWSLVQGFRRLQGQELLLLGAAGSVWLGYLTQALVSIDIPALVTLHWLSAGMVVAVSRPAEEKRFDFRFAGTSAGKGRRGRNKRRQQASAALAGVLALVGCTLAVIPLRADSAMETAARASAQDQPDEAVLHARRATELAPWNHHYFYRRGHVEAEAGRLDLALESFERAAALNEGDLLAATVAGQSAAALGDTDLAAQWYEEAVEREPNHPDFLVEAAQFFSEIGREERARELATRALKIRPGDEQAAEVLAKG